MLPCLKLTEGPWLRTAKGRGRQGLPGSSEVNYWTYKGMFSIIIASLYLALVSLLISLKCASGSKVSPALNVTLGWKRWLQQRHLGSLQRTGTQPMHLLSFDCEGILWLRRVPHWRQVETLEVSTLSRCCFTSWDLGHFTKWTFSCHRCYWPSLSSSLMF